MIQPTRVIAFDLEFTGPFDGDKKAYINAAGFAVYSINYASEVGPKFENGLRVCIKPPTEKHGFTEGAREFWERPEMQEKKAEFEKEAVSVAEAMMQITGFLHEYTVGCAVEEVVVVCDSTEDATWLNMYLARYANHRSLLTFNGSYTGWPIITDHVYYGATGHIQLWNIDHRIDRKFQIPGMLKGDHDPLNDAREIGLRFAYYLKHK